MYEFLKSSIFIILKVITYAHPEQGKYKDFEDDSYMLTLQFPLPQKERTEESHFVLIQLPENL